MPADSPRRRLASQGCLKPSFGKTLFVASDGPDQPGGDPAIVVTSYASNPEEPLDVLDRVATAFAQRGMHNVIVPCRPSQRSIVRVRPDPASRLNFPSAARLSPPIGEHAATASPGDSAPRHYVAPSSPVPMNDR